MRFKKGDRVLVMGNAYGMKLDIQWPIKGVIYIETRCNVPEPLPPGLLNQEYYQVTFDDPKMARELEKQGYNSRWVYPGNLLKRDHYCPVCHQPIEVRGPLNLVAEHNVSGKVGERCYGSHAPLEL